MLLPVDLMSVVNAGPVSANARDGSPGDSRAAPSWLLAADTDLSSESDKDLINKIFLSYTDDGQANPETRFAADLKQLLQAHGITLPPERSLLANAVSLASGQHSDEASELTWSVDELLQMSMSPMAGGNNLPLDDQTLPSVLSNWLAALTSGTTKPVTGADAIVSSPGAAISALHGGNETGAQLATIGAETGSMALTGGPVSAQPVHAGLATSATGNQPDGLLANVAGVLTAVNSAPDTSGDTAATAKDVGPMAPALLSRGTGGVLSAVNTAADAPIVTSGDTSVDISGDSAATAPDGEPMAPVLLSRAAGGGNPGSDQDIALRAALADDAARRSAEAAQLNPDVRKTSADGVNVSAFRSIQFNPSANGETTANAEDLPGNLAEQGKARSLQERIQAIVGQQGVALTSSTEAPAATGTSQAVNPADGITIVNRAEQRMFATETAQQAQSQAAQHTATRTADGLPRFAMDTAFGQQGWSDSLGRQLLVMSSQGVSSAQIRLDPPELGSLTVKIQMSADQQTSVSFVSQHAVVREALEQQLNRLQDLFRDQGLNLQDVSVSDQSSQQREGQEHGKRNGGGDSGTGEHESQAAEPTLVRSESLIDFYA